MPKTVNTFILGPLLGGYDPMKFITSFFTEFGGKLVENVEIITRRILKYRSNLFLPRHLGARSSAWDKVGS